MSFTRIAAASCLALSLVLPAQQALACSCVLFPIETARNNATYVFEGVLVRDEPTAEGSTATFRVERVWKGDVPATFTVPSLGTQSMCPPHLSVGQRYIIYVDPSDQGPPGIQACARYAQGAELAAERRALGAPIRRHPSTR
jgi:hypothetical protein